MINILNLKNKRRPRVKSSVNRVAMKKCSDNVQVIKIKRYHRFSYLSRKRKDKLCLKLAWSSPSPR